MSFQEKIDELRKIIKEILFPIIGSKVILVDAPYYNNIGDILIWEGTLDFLKSFGVKIIGCYSENTFLFPHIPEDVTILLMGGGNFGDLWRSFQEFRLKIIQKYPNNRIVVLPQSVHYDNESLVKEDANVFCRHSDLHLCARDRNSYIFLKKFFQGNSIYLIPDMAFCIAEEKLESHRVRKTDRELYFKRMDKELCSSPFTFEAKFETHDWPTFEKFPLGVKLVSYSANKIINWNSFLFPKKCLLRIIDAAASVLVRRKEVRTGLQFLSQYNYILSTRLHAMILGILLHTPIEYINNSTGKLSAFADTWLSDLMEVKPYDATN